MDTRESIERLDILDILDSLDILDIRDALATKIKLFRLSCVPVER